MTSLGGESGLGSGDVPQFGDWKDMFSKLVTFSCGEVWKLLLEEVEEALERASSLLSDPGEGERYDSNVYRLYSEEA
jgi:hypothetical protein